MLLSGRLSARPSLPYELHPPPPALLRVRTNAKLVVRSEAGLDSKKRGELAAGSAVLLLKEVENADGVVRAAVATESSPRGVMIDPLGWVTSFKDGELPKVLELDKKVKAMNNI